MTLGEMTGSIGLALWKIYIQSYYDVDNEDKTRTLFLELERE